MKLKVRLSTLMILTVALLTMASCSGGQQNTTATNSSASSSSPQVARGATSIAKDATITADPNPIKVCDGSGLGITKLTYNAKGPSQVDVRVDSPNGGLLAHTGVPGTATSGKWVSNGTVFYLQDVSDGKPTTPENTLATLTVGVTTEGCK